MKRNDENTSSSAAQPAAPLALSMGEPGGIGPDIALTAWRELREHGPAFCFIGPAELLESRAAMLGMHVPIATLAHFDEAAEAFRHALPVFTPPGMPETDATPGQALARNAAAVLFSIEQAVALTLRGKAGGVVTLPIQKESLYEAGFDFEGHTDYLAALAQRLGSLRERPLPVMMLTAKGLRTVPVTIHIPLREVPARLSEEAIFRQGMIVAQDLRRYLGIDHPRLAVSGLNPHAGEGGRMGDEEQRVIIPAIERLRAAGVEVIGPLPADTMFHAEARTRYDIALCMYHDQALIPVKTLDFHGGVNATLGLPFVRTSPDHGTALELAGSGRARADSLVAALKLAAEMAHHARDAGSAPACPDARAVESGA